MQKLWIKFVVEDTAVGSILALLADKVEDLSFGVEETVAAPAAPRKVTLQTRKPSAKPIRLLTNDLLKRIHPWDTFTIIKLEDQLPEGVMGKRVSGLVAQLVQQGWITRTGPNLYQTTQKLKEWKGE